MQQAVRAREMKKPTHSGSGQIRIIGGQR
ncbi:16S rRNA (guanine(966)-N(2))-methyltransferase RsmD, partial [Salmonella enterica subsp. enterica serovar Newport]